MEAPALDGLLILNHLSSSFTYAFEPPVSGIENALDLFQVAGRLEAILASKFRVTFSNGVRAFSFYSMSRRSEDGGLRPVIIACTNSLRDVGLGEAGGVFRAINEKLHSVLVEMQPDCAPEDRWLLRCQWLLCPDTHIMHCPAI